MTASLCSGASQLPSATTGRRWVAPSEAVRREETPPAPAGQNNQEDENTQHNDLVFRRVRGILNKITPEKFEKLTVDILNVGLDSTIVLKGVILLVSDNFSTF